MHVLSIFPCGFWHYDSCFLPRAWIKGYDPGLQGVDWGSNSQSSSQTCRLFEDLQSSRSSYFPLCNFVVTITVKSNMIILQKPASCSANLNAGQFEFALPREDIPIVLLSYQGITSACTLSSLGYLCQGCLLEGASTTSILHPWKVLSADQISIFSE